MTMPAEVRGICLALPGATESSHFEQPDFRVGKRIFASFPQADRLTVHHDPEHASALYATDPDAFVLHPGVWGARGWVRIVLERVEPDLVRDLIHDSWHRIAAQRLRAEYDARFAPDEHPVDG